MPLEVRVLNGALILTAKKEAPQPPAEPEVVAQLRKACKKLSPRKQAQIAGVYHRRQHTAEATTTQR